MNAAPLILITANRQEAGSEFDDCSMSLSACYTKSIAGGGGIPWVAPSIPSQELVSEMVRRSDGVMLTGGDDVEPGIYAKRLSPKLRKTVGSPDPERDMFELQVIAEVLRQQKPMLAICRGLQIVNVALGGDLVVDIETQVPHALNHRCMDRKDQVVHDVALVPGSLLSGIVGEDRLGVNSSHHQAAGSIAKCLKVTARSADGIVEGLELGPGAGCKPPFFLAVQFHPERLTATHEAHRAIFKAFLEVCARSGT